MLNTAIIVGAGSGTRFGGERPKQFADLCGRPVIFHALATFEACAAIDEIVLVVSTDWIEEIHCLLRQFKFSKIKTVVVGGASRPESVRNGLSVVDPETAWITAVHDGARPLVTVDEISRTVEAASLHGAACLVADVTDTIKQVDRGFITGTVSRNDLRRALTPQAFQHDILVRAFETGPGGENITDECTLVESLGVRVFCVEGNSTNLKITRPDDLRLAEMYMRSER